MDRSVCRLADGKSLLPITLTPNIDFLSSVRMSETDSSMNQPSPSVDPEKDQRLNSVLAEYLKRKDAGRPVNQKALLAAYPDLTDALQSWFDGEALMAGGVLATTKPGKVPPRSSVRETIRPNAVESDTASEFAPRIFGRYQLLRPLGEGAMGSVFLAKDTTLDRQVALKVPKSEGTGNAEFMQRFTREAKAAAALKHPNICSVYDAGEHEGTAWGARQIAVLGKFGLFDSVGFCSITSIPHPNSGGIRWERELWAK